jgi:4-hydroxybenzoate polyprenyltransferase
MSGAGLWVAAPLSLVGALLIWPMLAGVDDKRPETALAGFKFNAVIGAAVLLAFAVEPIWRTIRPSLGV